MSKREHSAVRRIVGVSMLASSVFVSTQVTAVTVDECMATTGYAIEGTTLSVVDLPAIVAVPVFNLPNPVASEISCTPVIRNKVVSNNHGTARAAVKSGVGIIASTGAEAIADGNGLLRQGWLVIRLNFAFTLTDPTPLAPIDFDITTRLDFDGVSSMSSNNGIGVNQVFVENRIDRIPVHTAPFLSDNWAFEDRDPVGNSVTDVVHETTLQPNQRYRFSSAIQVRSAATSAGVTSTNPNPGTGSASQTVNISFDFDVPDDVSIEFDYASALGLPSPGLGTIAAPIPLPAPLLLLGSTLLAMLPFRLRRGSLPSPTTAGLD